MKKTFIFAGLLLLSALETKAQIASADLWNLPASPHHLPPGPAYKPPVKGPEFEDYGGKLGIGISIANGLGVPVRCYINPKNVVEAGMYIGGVAIYNTDDFEIESIESNFMGGLGYTHFGNRFLKARKIYNKVRAHGVALRLNHLFGDFNTTFASLGWAMETFRENRTNRSFIFELGLQARFPDFVYNGVVYDEPGPGIYLRLHWNFFVD